MRDTRGFVTYAFTVVMTTDDYELVNNFGYRSQEKFQENMTRRLMKTVAEYPHIVALEVSPIDLDVLENASEEYEEYVEEDEDE